MTRTVQDQAALLDILIGYDPEDPITALGVGQSPSTYTSFLDKDGLKGARVGILHESMGSESEPGSQGFIRVSQVFDKVASLLESAGATLVDPVEIPELNELLAKRAGGGEEAWRVYFDRTESPPFRSRDEMVQSSEYAQVMRSRTASRWAAGDSAHYDYLLAREKLMINFLKVMADFKLDAVVHRSAEHEPT